MVTALAYGVVFGYRTDYLGHYLAGFGGTLLLVWAVALLPTLWRSWSLVIGTIVAIALGFVTESTIFKLAIFDPVDFFNQSLGGVVAAAAVFGGEGSRVTAALLAAMSVVVIIVGFYFAFL